MDSKHHNGNHQNNNHYLRLLLMAVMSFISMFVLMYAMVDTPANILLSLNQFYMAGLMTAPMVVIELALMGAMYDNKRWNALIIAASAIALVVFWVLIRQQTGISDKQFLRSMIPHHASAILMCEQAPITDPEIQDLCSGIISGQQAEIDQMRARLVELER